MRKGLLGCAVRLTRREAKKTAAYVTTVSGRTLATMPIPTATENKQGMTSSGGGNSSTSDSTHDDFAIVASAKRREASSAESRTGQEQDANKRVRYSKENGPVKVAPIFQRKQPQTAADGAGEDGKASAGASSLSPQQLAWKEPLGVDKTCLRGEAGKPFAHAIAARAKNATKTVPMRVACFDLDGCLIKPKAGKTWPSATDAFDFEQAFRGTFARVRKEYEEGAIIAIVSNQDQTRQKDTLSKRLVTWKQKLQHVTQAIGCPLLVLAALTRDGFRKPGRLMWDLGIVQSFTEAGGSPSDLDTTNAFFVGDAAGRTGDHSDTDRKWALNLGMPFYTPEEFFLGQKPKDFTLRGWKPVLHAPIQGEAFSPSAFFEQGSDKRDLVLFVGPPSSGKTSFFREHFAPRGYEHINQDKLKTAAKCLAVARDTLLAGRSVVIDNTNRNATTRAPYIRLAHSMADKVQARCIYFAASQELCTHNNFFRVRAGLQRADEPRQLLPGIAISSFFANFEVPTRAEGFDSDVHTVHWSFRGDEEAKRRWLMRWD